MNKTFLMAVVAAFGVAGTASAQNASTQIDATPSNLTFRGGIVLPIDDNLRDNSDFYGGLGLDYEFPAQLIRGSSTFASLDWYFKGTTGSNGNVFPIGLNQRFYSSKGNPFYESGRSYFFVGAGVAIIDVGGKSSAKYMLRGGIGTEVGPNIVAEAAVTFSDKSRTNVRANAVGIYLGYRF